MSEKIKRNPLKGILSLAVGEIVNSEERKIGGKRRTLYTLKTDNKRLVDFVDEKDEYQLTYKGRYSVLFQEKVFFDITMTQIQSQKDITALRTTKEEGKGKGETKVGIQHKGNNIYKKIPKGSFTGVWVETRERKTYNIILGTDYKLTQE